MSATSVLHEEIALEQQHVNRVYARVAELRRAAAVAEADGYRIASVGTYGALVERDAMVFHQARRRYLLDAEHEGLVFGRLDLRDGTVYHIGRLGVRDEHAEPLVIDWRAPAAASFYQATPTDPQGIVRRRMIRCIGETVIGLEDDLLDPQAAPPGMRVVGDGALVAALARATGRGMRDIVATIQREQDAAIRSPASGVTIVSGGPGTGKTAVALHRAAYLLYHDRARYARGGVLVVGPSPGFINYISQVLPSLGEESATLCSLGSLVDGVVADRLDRPEVAAIKGSLRMRRVLGRAVRGPVPGAPARLRLLYRGGLLQLAAKELAEVRRSVLRGGVRRNEARAAAAVGLLDALWRQAPHDRTRNEFDADVGDRPEFHAFLRAWWPVLSPCEVLGWLADPKHLARYAAGVLSADEVAQLAASYRAGGLSAADVALLDELADLLGTPPAPPRRREGERVLGVRESASAGRRRTHRGETYQGETHRREYAHIVVDEAQEVSPMQWRMLARRGRYASWTIVGDPAQSAWTGDAAEVSAAWDAAFAGRRRSEYTLTINYRNSAEIFRLAERVVRQVQPDIVLPRAVRVTGVEPKHVVTDQLASAAQAAAVELLAAVEGTVGAIAAVARRDEVAGWLAGLDDDRLQVVSGLEAKGLEFDGVLLVEPAELLAESPTGVRTLYVALSRATQRLTTVASSEAWLSGAGAPRG